jgi:Ca2+-binding RTX toxin-like protein
MNSHVTPIHIEILGQSNARGLKKPGDDGVTGQQLIYDRVSNLNVFSQVTIDNHSVGSSAVDGNRMSPTLGFNGAWWYPDSNSAGGALLDAVSAMKADIAATGADRLAVVWSQGETEASLIRQGLTDVARYKAATLAVFHYIEQQVGVNVKFFIAKTEQYDAGYGYASGRTQSFVEGMQVAHTKIQVAQDQLAASQYDNIYMAGTLDGRAMADTLHLTDEAYDEVGDQLGTFMAETYYHSVMIDGTGGNDHLRGSSASDVLTGSWGRDTLEGSSGNDIFRFTDKWESYAGNADMIRDFAVGADKIDLTGLGYYAVVTGTATLGQLRLGYSANTDRTYVRDDHSDFEFTLKGNYAWSINNKDFIFGYSSISGQYLQGDWNSNRIVGSAGNDTINGEGGRDTLTGGDGYDMFQFSDVTESQRGNADRVTDFVVGVDKFDLSYLGFYHLELNAGYTDASELRLAYSSNSNTTYVRSDQENFEIALLGGDYRHSLTENDFIF